MAGSRPSEPVLSNRFSGTDGVLEAEKPKARESHSSRPQTAQGKGGAGDRTHSV